MSKTRIVGARHISEKSKKAGGPIFFWKVPDELIIPFIPKKGMRPEAIVETERGSNRIALYLTFNVDENEKIHDKRSGKFLEIENMKSVISFPEEESKKSKEV